MDYTKSVYEPEVALQHSRLSKERATKEDLMKIVGLEGGNMDQNEPILQQMLKQMK